MATPVADSVPLLTAGNNHNGTLEDEFISGLVQGGSWTFSGPRTLTYSLDLNFDGPVKAWGQSWTTAVDKAFAAWEAVIDVDFVRVGTPGAKAQNESVADISIALAPGLGQEVIAGQGLFPDPQYADELLDGAGYSRSTGAFPYPRPEGDITFDNQHFVFKGLAQGSMGFMVILHEIGHSLGLKHSTDEGPDGRPTFADLGLNAQDSSPYTVMSGEAFPFGSATPLIADILALQHVYGANMSYHTGNDIYRMSSAYVRAIWDAGGHDVLRANELSSAQINLAPGSVSRETGGQPAIAIAYDVIIEDAVGSNGDDRIVGNRVNNVLSGEFGDDTLDGGAGRDTLRGGQGDDVYILGSAGDIAIDDGSFDSDTILARTSRSLSPQIENLVLLGSADIDGTGNSFDNDVTGNSGNNVLVGLEGDDFLDGGAGIDELRGGMGDDTYGVDRRQDVVIENEGSGVDTLRSTLSQTLADSLENLQLLGTGDLVGHGNASANRLTGNSGRNRLYGHDGRDVLDGGEGADTLYGGEGGDLYILDSSLDVVVEEGESGEDTIRSAASYALKGEEHIVLIGEADANAIGNGYANRMYGNSGSNHLVGGGGDDTLIGGDGDDVLAGGSGDDSMYVESEKDIVVEALNGGTDTVYSDVAYELGDYQENLVLNLGKSGTGNSLDNVITAANHFAMTLYGGDGDDTLHGSNQRDTLDGGAGVDVLEGGEGNDQYFVDVSGDTVIERESEGIDTVLTSRTHQLAQNVENATLLGSADARLTGNELDNSLTGNSGDNVLDGGVGRDRLRGGEGNDTYVLADPKAATFFEYRSWVGFVEFVPLTAASFSGVDSPDDADTLVDTVHVGYLLEGARFGSADFSTRGLGSSLLPGEYDGAERYPFEPPGQPGLDVTINSSGSSTLDGSFTVLAAEFDYSGATPEITELLIHWKIDGGSSGTVSLNYDWGASPDTVIELAGGGRDTVRTPFSYTLTANVEDLVLTGTRDSRGIGNSLGNLLTGNGGDNLLDGRGGADELRGMGGNDTLIWRAGDDLLNGGAGTDTLKVTSGNLDLTHVPNANLVDIEQLDLTGGGGNVLTLGAADILAMSPTASLKVLGGAEDTVHIVGSVTPGAEADGFVAYTVGAAALLIDADITVV